MCTSAHGDPSSGSAAIAQQDSISVDIAAEAPAGGSASSSLLMAPKPRRRVSEADSAAASSLNMFQAADAANGTSHGKTHGSPGRSGSTFADHTSEATQQSRAGPSLAASQPKLLKPAAMKKRQPTVIPHMAAVGALVGALARANELDQALQLYKQVCRQHFPVTCKPAICLALARIARLCASAVAQWGGFLGGPHVEGRPFRRLHGVLERVRRWRGIL